MLFKLDYRPIIYHWMPVYLHTLCLWSNIIYTFQYIDVETYTLLIKRKTGLVGISHFPWLVLCSKQTTEMFCMSTKFWQRQCSQPFVLCSFLDNQLSWKIHIFGCYLSVNPLCPSNHQLMFLNIQLQLFESLVLSYFWHLPFGTHFSTIKLVTDSPKFLALSSQTECYRQCCIEYRSQISCSK